MKRLRLVLASLALTAVPIVTQPSPASAELYGCNAVNGGTWGSTGCNYSAPPLGGQQRVTFNCRLFNGTVYSVAGPWVAVREVSKQSCYNGGLSSYVVAQLAGPH